MSITIFSALHTLSFSKEGFKMETLYVYKSHKYTNTYTCISHEHICVIIK